MAKGGSDKAGAPRGADDARRFRLAMDASADMIALVDRATMRYIDVNETICRVLGYSRDELLAMGPADIVDIPRAKLERDYDALIADPQGHNSANSTYRCKDGTLLPFESARHVHRSGDGWIIVAVARDIRDRLAAEAALRESEERFRRLTDLAADWYWEQDADLRFVSTGGASDARGGITPESHIGKRRWELPNTELLEQTWDQHRAVLEARQPFRDLLLSRTDNRNQRRYVSVAGMPMFSPEGAFRGYRGVATDVTDRVRGEQLLRLEHQIGKIVSESESAALGVRAILEAVCASEDWGCGRFLRYDEPDGLLRFQDGFARDPALAEYIEISRKLTLRPGEGLAGRILLDGRPAWSEEIERDPRMNTRPLSSGFGISGVFAFAIVSGGKTVGVLSFSTRHLRPPDQRLLQTTQVIGSQVGQFLQRKRAEHALRDSEARFRSLTQMSSDFFWEADVHHRFTQVVHGRNYKAKFGTAILGKTAWDLPSTVPDEAGWAALRNELEARRPFRDFEIGRPRSGGGASYFSVSGEPRHSPEGEFLGYRGIGRDITSEVLARERVASLAYSDALTGLANRASLGPAFEQAIERARRRNASLAAMFLDLDGFKAVNDEHGHPAGDRLLAEVGRRIRASVRASDLVARLGGDEFFLVLEDQQEADSAETVAQKLLAEIRKPYAIAPGQEVSVSGSVGIAFFPDDAGDAASLLSRADQAMYLAKLDGKDRIRLIGGPSGLRPKRRTTNDPA